LGQQQILLIVLSMILLGVAITVGVSMYFSNADSANQDQIYSQLNYASSAGYSHYLKAKTFNGAEKNLDELLKQESIDLWLPKFEGISGEPIIKKISNGFSISVISSNGKHKATIFENVSDNSRTVSWEEIN